jgi:hypothetical protein
MRTDDGLRERFPKSGFPGFGKRLRAIETELLEIAAGALMPSEREIAAALLAEARRIERNASGLS